MPVIKHTKAAPLASGAHVLDLADLKRLGERILEDAEREAERIVQAARAECEALAADAEDRGHAEGQARGHEVGRAEGHEAGRAEAQAAHEAELAVLADRWNRALDGWNEHQAAMHADAREDLVRLALVLAGRICGRVVEVDPTVVQDQVAATLALVRRTTSATVVAHPEDRPLLEEVLPSITARFASLEHVMLDEDEGVERGGCVVRTARGVIDARIDTQLRRIAEAMLPGADLQPGDPELGAHADEAIERRDEAPHDHEAPAEARTSDEDDA